MTVMLTDLMGLSAVAGDDEFQITELFHDPRDLKLRYAALDLGGWLSRHEVLVEIERFGAPDVLSGRWPLSLTRDEVDEAPVWSHEEPALDHWPPLIVGPFGGTYSPLLLWSQAELAAAEDGAEGARKVATLEQTGEWIGCECFDDNGLVGRAVDLLIEEAPMRLTHAVVEGEDGRRELPLTDLAYTAEQGHAVFRLQG